MIQWLKSKYRTSEWGANSEFLRLEGYTPGNYFFLGATLILTADNVLFFHLLTGANVAIFDPSPKGFISLVPSFWSVHNWKAAVFMHHDFALLEQVFSRQV